MADTRKIVKVFLASPGDLLDERRAAKSVAEEFNRLWAERLGYHVELVGWEETIGGFGRPQDVINQDLDRCELFVGMMFRRWGTPPGGESSYSSGFEEEFARSVKRRRATGKPEISLLFKGVDPAALRDPGPELKKVIEFKNAIASERILLYEEFNEPSEFEAKFRRCITTYVQKLEVDEGGVLSSKSQIAPQESTEPQGVVDSEAENETPLSIEGSQFLRDFIARTEQPNSHIEAVEVARFRLLGSIIARQGNDDRSLNTHDANLIFAEGARFALSYREIMGLVDCALEHFSNENTPLWRWYAAANGFQRALLSLRTLFGTPLQRAGALAAMKLISEPIYTDWGGSGLSWSRGHYLQSWLADDTASVKVAALGYLGECGSKDDLPRIKEESDKGNYQTSGAAVDAILRINLRESRDRAIARLYELQPESVRDDLVQKIFGDGSAIGVDILLKGTSHRSAAVRRTTVTLLGKGGALSLEVAQRLLTDDDAQVRLEALRAAIKAGRSFTDDEAKGVLIKPTRTWGLGMFGLSAPTDPAGEACWKQFRRDRFFAMAMQDLAKAAEAEKEWVLERDAELALIEREFSSRGDILRALIDNRFKSEFSQRLDAMARRIGADHQLVVRTKALEENLTKEFTRLGLDVLCRRLAAEDLSRVRDVLKSGFVTYSDEDIEYLRKYGEWEDVPLLVGAVSGPAPGLSLLSDYDQKRYRAVARAIYRIGRTRLPELLQVKMPSRLLANLLVELADGLFRKLADSQIRPLFHSTDERVRKAAALKSVHALPKSRTKRLLGSYLSESEPRYYNVIHWLDLGVSAPKDVALKAAAKALASEW